MADGWGPHMRQLPHQKVKTEAQGLVLTPGTATEDTTTLSVFQNKIQAPALTAMSPWVVSALLENPDITCERGEGEFLLPLPSPSPPDTAHGCHHFAAPRERPMLDQGV